MMKQMAKLYIVIPCYNEMEVLPITSDIFLSKLNQLIDKKIIASDSRILFVDDGSSDDTWDIISHLSHENEHFIGIRQSRNRGHQNAVLAGLMEVREKCDVTITIDCDGQDDINAMDEMMACYYEGCHVVYGVRENRRKDSLFKRSTAQMFYRLMNKLGAEVVYNHADYRLISSTVLDNLADFKEVNIFLRGMVPLVGYKSTSVYYGRAERVAGKSHYPLKKMLSLAIDGVTSLSIKPLHIIAGIGLVISLMSFAGVIWSVIEYFKGDTVSGWASMTCIVCFVGGVQLISLGVLGEYIGKIYMETKHRPRYIISDKTYENDIKETEGIEDRR